MIKKLNISKSFHVIENAKYKKTLVTEANSKKSYDKLFLSHISEEDNPKWIPKERHSSFQYVARHPSMSYSVTILSSVNQLVCNGIYAIALNPIYYWLYKTSNQLIYVGHSNLAKDLSKTANGIDSIFRMHLDANTLSEFISNVRPTGYIIESVDVNTHHIFTGTLETVGEQSLFVPKHKGFPTMFLGPSRCIKNLNVNTPNKDKHCELLKWEYDSPAIGRLINFYPNDFKRSFRNIVHTKYEAPNVHSENVMVYKNHKESKATDRSLDGINNTNYQKQPKITNIRLDNVNFSKNGKETKIVNVRIDCVVPRNLSKRSILNDANHDSVTVPIDPKGSEVTVALDNSVKVPKNETETKIISGHIDSVVSSNLLNDILHSSVEKTDACLNQAISELLKTYNLKDEPFSDLIFKSLENNLSFSEIPDTEIARRENFINKCVISIDPGDAKDIDDALHVEQLPDGNYEVGVHIADVSHYVRSGTLIDKEASERATSIYLIHKVIPMLPEILSERLCSLNPGQNKLTFSVIFVVAEDGKIISERFVKTVIKPKLRLSYDDADKLIKGTIQSKVVNDHPDFNVALNSVQLLYKMAKILRAQRQKNGALTLEKVEIKFRCDIANDTLENKERIIKHPLSFFTKSRCESSFLIEEWMLLANQAAARLLFNHAVSDPKSRNFIGSFLRNHQKPDKKQTDNLMSATKDAGIILHPLDTNSLQQQISKFQVSNPPKSLLMSYLCYFNLKLAMYSCAEQKIGNKQIDIADPSSPFHHYGLNVPLYTHFTSPIRRYADIIVHRQIAAIIDHESDQCDSQSRVRAVAACNEKTIATRRMRDELQSLYMAAYLRDKGCRLTKALILTEHRNQLRVFVPSAGIVLGTKLDQFVPWALRIDKQKSGGEADPVSYKLEYHLDHGKYHVTTVNGFRQYRLRSHKARVRVSGGGSRVGAAVSLDEQVDAIRTRRSHREYRAALRGTEAPPTAEKGARGTLGIRISEPFHCLVFCRKDQLKLIIEMPFPGQLAHYKSTIAEF